MSIDDLGIPLFMGDEPYEGEARQEKKERRFMLVGGPLGPLYPLGIVPMYEEEEEEDPNP